MRVEGHPAYFALVPDQLGHALARVHVPDVRSAVETARNYLVPERVVERQCLDYIFVPQKGVQLSSVLSILQFTSSVLRSSNEPRSVLIETYI